MTFNYYQDHSEEIISMLVGNILGDAWGEKRWNSTRFHIHMGSSDNCVEYLRWIHLQYAKHGYCSNTAPTLRPQSPAKNGKVYYSQKIRTFSYKTFNWLYDAFYKKCPLTNRIVKTIPEFIGDLLTPKAMAFWYMDDGSYSSSGFLFSTNSFSEEDVDRLRDAMHKRYGINATKQYQQNQFRIYVVKKDAAILANIIKPYVIDCMRYKLGGFG